MAHQGKCDKCQLHFVWEKSFYLPFWNRNVKCPGCGGMLQGATYKCRYPISRVEPIVESERRVG